MKKYITLIIIGFLLLIKGADFLVEGASDIAKKFKIPTLIIGLTIVAIGTAMPELMVSATASIEGHADIAIGNVIGSNISNLFLILGICSIIKTLNFKKETITYENPFTIFTVALLLLMCNNGSTFEIKQISRFEGIILLIICIMFIIHNIFRANKEKKKIIVLQSEGNSDIDNISVLKAILKIIIGIIGLKIGGDLVVDYSSKIAEVLGISEKIISLSIIAFSTSLPELITSITAAFKGDVDMAIGNVIGSQIFNILLILGVSSLLNPINYSTIYNKELVLLLIGNIIFTIFPYIPPEEKMTKGNGAIFVIIYIMYVVSLMVN